MTTREQLGLNANWIPMDSSKSGGSDEFLVKKVNQLEEKVNELKELEYKPISKEIIGGTYSPMLKLEPDYTNHRVKIFLKDVSDKVQVRFKVNTNMDWTVVTVDKPYTISLAEEYSPLLAKYGLRKMALDVILKNVQVKGFESLPVQIEADGYQGFKSKSNTADGVNLTYRSEYLNVVNEYRSKLVIHENTDSQLTDVDSVIYPSPRSNVFTIDLRTPFRYNVFILESGASYVDGTTYNGSSNANILCTWKEGLDLRFKEVIIPWRSQEDQLKAKLSPIQVSNGGHGVEKYGYYGDKSGHPIYVFAPKLHGCLSYIYKTDCSYWYGYFFDHFSATFIKNGKVVPRTQGDVFKQATDPRGAYNFTNNVVSIDRDQGYGNNYHNLKDLDLSKNSYMQAAKSYSIRQHAGIVDNDFDNLLDTVEIWSFLPGIIGNSSIIISTQMLSSIINKDTGEFIRDNDSYNTWKNNACVLRQIIAKNGNEVYLHRLEVTTLDVFFKNFIAKSEEWKKKNPDKVETDSIKGDYTRKFIWNGIYDYL